ncbi:FAD-dependent thymidylate synthase, partial [Candidatus Saccharibacteria bacterium]|nr:FAD-dependent thymidylate synthase [Candidatus Saccharibacteria bacterium]
NQGIHCLVDRSYLTTLAIQYYARGDVKDYDTINQIINFAIDGMEPDLTVVMDAPVKVLQERMSERYQAERFDALQADFLEKVRSGYLWEAHNRSLPVVYAIGAAEKVAGEIWNHVAALLGKPGETIKIDHTVAAAHTIQQPSVTSPASVDKPAYLTKSEQGNFIIADDGKAFLDTAVTNTSGNVYAFNDTLTPLTIAAAMARLSRRADDMRVTILDEFIGSAGKDEKLLQRVITAYGDDSVQQLVGQHVVVENASNLLTKKLEWGRLAAYLEQSTRYIYFDRKDDNGKYRYFTPSSLSVKVAQQYAQSMDQIFDLYSEMVHKLTDYIGNKSSVPAEERDIAWKGAVRAQACDAVRPVLPVATTATVGIYASGQALESLIMHLLSDELPEARTVGQQLLDEARKVIPTFLERADKPDRGGALIAYRANTHQAVKTIANEQLPEQHSAPSEPVTLTDYWPRNEIDIVADILYEHSSLPLGQIRQEVSDWDYDKKYAVFKAAVGERLNRRHKPGRAFEKAHYSWDIMCDYGIFRDLQRHRMVDDLNWQQLTPRYGYEIPALIDEAGLTDEYEQCFDLSLALYSLLQAEGHSLEAQYATLLGHRMRWKITYNAREAFHFHELRTSPQGHPGYRKLVLQMHEQLAKVHPLMADAMLFVNKGEDEELTRLAAERYTQYKLNQLQ